MNNKILTLIKQNFLQFKNNHNKITAILKTNKQLNDQLLKYIQQNNNEFQKPIWLIKCVLNETYVLPKCKTCRKNFNI